MQFQVAAAEDMHQPWRTATRDLGPCCKSMADPKGGFNAGSLRVGKPKPKQTLAFCLSRCHTKAHAKPSLIGISPPTGRLHRLVLGKK